MAGDVYPLSGTHTRIMFPALDLPQEKMLSPCQAGIEKILQERYSRLPDLIFYTPKKFLNHDTRILVELIETLQHG